MYDRTWFELISVFFWPSSAPTLTHSRASEAHELSKQDEVQVAVSSLLGASKWAMLWACEAAHMPVVWATQVLEALARTGLPTLDEITDAAMDRNTR